MIQIIFSGLILFLSLSDQAANLGCDAPIPRASECWIVSPATGITTTITLTTKITYTLPSETQP